MTSRVRPAPLRPSAGQRAIAAQHGYQIVFEKRLLIKGARSAAVARFRSLTERGGAIAGRIYALAASSVLHSVERLQDASADRKFRRHAQLPPLDAKVLGAAPDANNPPPTT